jgi:hypothetical protein
MVWTRTDIMRLRLIRGSRTMGRLRRVFLLPRVCIIANWWVTFFFFYISIGRSAIDDRRPFPYVFASLAFIYNPAIRVLSHSSHILTLQGRILIR